MSKSHWLNSSFLPQKRKRWNTWEIFLKTFISWQIYRGPFNLVSLCLPSGWVFTSPFRTLSREAHWVQHASLSSVPVTNVMGRITTILITLTSSQDESEWKLSVYWPEFDLGPLIWVHLTELLNTQLPNIQGLLSVPWIWQTLLKKPCSALQVSIAVYFVSGPNHSHIHCHSRSSWNGRKRVSGGYCST